MRAKKLTKREQELADSWAKIVESHSKPIFGSKYGGAKRSVASVKKPVAVDNRIPVTIEKFQGPTGKPVQDPARLYRNDPSLYERELAARERVFTVMPGHKQGYQLVTDPEMVPQMGKKTA